MEELRMIAGLLNDLWKFIKRYQGIRLTDEICGELRREQEAIVERYGASENVHKLASDSIAAALGYFYRSTSKRR